MLNSEEIRPIALAVIELPLSEGISQSDSQLVEKSVKRKFLKFHNNLIQRFRVDLKTFLGLAIPNQCYYAVTKLMVCRWDFRARNHKP